MSSKLSQTPVSITDHLPDTAAVTTVSQEYGSEPDSQPSVDLANEQTSPLVASDTSELVDGEGEKVLAESKPLVEANGIQTSTSQPAGTGGNNVLDNQIIEPLPEMKKGWFSFKVFY